MKMKMLLAAAVAVGGLTAAAAYADSGSLTIVSWGGAYSMSQHKAYDEPFTKKTGVKIQNVDKSADALAGIRSQVEANNVTWNIVDMLQADAQRACDEGLIMRIDPDKWLAPAPDGTPASKDFVEGTLGDCFVPQILYATLFAYNKTAFPNGGPQTIQDVWDVKKFPGMRALEKIPQKNLEWALIADGVPADKVYDVLATKEGQDRAFKSLDKIKKNVIWWDQGAQPPQLLADKEAVIASAYNGRIFNAQVAENQPFAIGLGPRDVRGRRLGGPGRPAEGQGRPDQEVHATSRPIRSASRISPSTFPTDRPANRPRRSSASTRTARRT